MTVLAAQSSLALGMHLSAEDPELPVSCSFGIDPLWRMEVLRTHIAIRPRDVLFHQSFCTLYELTSACFSIFCHSLFPLLRIFQTPPFCSADSPDLSCLRVVALVALPMSNTFPSKVLHADPSSNTPRREDLGYPR